MSGSKESADLGCFSKVEAKKSCPPARNISHPLRYYEFTQEEIKVLEECDKESFYQRCIPISTLFATMTYAGIKYGLVRRNPHFGAVPKVLTSATFGYCLGRISYKSEYDRKIRRLSASSHLGNVMRRYHLESNPPDPKKR